MKMIFENHAIIVEVNSSGEIFVKHKETGVQARVKNDHAGLAITAVGNEMVPFAVHGLSAILIRRG